MSTPFDWSTFCKQSGVPFVESGASTAKGNIYIHCPFCGAADKSHHMGLSLSIKQPYWGCWRDPTHRGVAPQRLLVALLSCSWEEATKIVKELGGETAEDYDAILRRFIDAAEPKAEPIVVKKRALILPTEFKRLDNASSYSLPYKRYLSRRGFDDAAKVSTRFDLRYCLRGPFGGRLIIPIYHKEKLVSWTARDVTGKSTLRYRTLGTDAENCAKTGYGPALSNLADVVYNGDRATRRALSGKARTLVVCEGPFDAIKVDWLGRSVGVSAVALFGSTKRAQVLELLSIVEQGYESVVVALDADALKNAIHLVDMLRGLLNCSVRRLALPDGVKDPGDLSERNFNRLF